MSVGGIFSGLKFNEPVKDMSANTSFMSTKEIDAKLGDKITGKVVSSENGNVTIDVNGKLLNAKLEGNVSFNNGDTVTFDVKGSTNNQITLSPLYTNTANISTAIKALTYANLPVSDMSISMADSMINQNMKIDSDSLISMYRQVSSFAETDPATIVEMKKFGLEINTNNIESFTAFKNYENQVTSGMNDIMNSIPAALKELSITGNNQEFTAFALDVINTFRGGEEIVPEDNLIKNPEIQGENSVENQTDNQAGSSQNSTAEPAIISNKTIINGDVLNDAIINGSEKEINQGVINENLIKGELAKGDMVNSGLDRDNNALESDKELLKQVISEHNDLTSNGTLNSAHDITSKDGWNSFTMFEKSNMVDALKSAGLDELTSKHLLSENATDKDFIDATRNLLMKGKLNDAMKEMISSDKFGSVLKNQMSSQWLLNPIDVSQKETVENLYRKLNEQVKNLTESLSNASMSNAGLSNTALAANLADMNNNLDFMNQMNNVYQYIQLPLKMAGSEATGDLFVYTDKKSLARKDGNVSALLHLDMDHLGPLDVYASITPGNNVFTKFTLADDSVLDFIEANMHILNERLENRGYSLKTEMVTKDNNTSSGNTDDVPKTNIMKYSFDMRA